MTSNVFTIIIINMSVIYYTNGDYKYEINITKRKLKINKISTYLNGLFDMETVIYESNIEDVNYYLNCNNVKWYNFYKNINKKKVNIIKCLLDDVRDKLYKLLEPINDTIDDDYDGKWDIKIMVPEVNGTIELDNSLKNMLFCSSYYYGAYKRQTSCSRKNIITLSDIRNEFDSDYTTIINNISCVLDAIDSILLEL